MKLAKGASFRVTPITDHPWPARRHLREKRLPPSGQGASRRSRNLEDRCPAQDSAAAGHRAITLLRQ